MKIVNTIASVIPKVPPLTFYRFFEDAMREVAPSATQAQLDQARALTKTEDVEEALWAVDALDTGDKGIAVYTGLKSAYGLFFGSKGGPTSRFESDPQQATDAALKALGISYVVSKLFTGTIPEKLAQFNRLPAGKHIMCYYGVAELALPFTDNVISGAGTVMQKLMDHAGKDSTTRIATLVGSAASSEAQGVFQALIGQFNSVASNVVQHVGPFADKVKSFLPGAMATTDKVAGMVATGVDMMPVWGLLGSRLAAEACAYRTIRG
ncbi:MAG: hypothetical protein Q8O67_10580 [Deltaproteobacteria bacterium]|nr:hypothetical protein [Deltaproteobacteria bacterium]